MISNDFSLKGWWIFFFFSV